MKKTNPKKSTVAFTVLLTLILAFSVFTSCSTAASNGEGTGPSASGSSTNREENTIINDENKDDVIIPPETQDIEKDKYEEQITYYMELVESLQAQLLSLREQNYIDECAYKLKIESLEQNVEALQAMVKASNKHPELNEQAKPIPEKTSSQSEFEYSIQDSEITITAYTGRSTDITIPSNIDGMPVTKIGQSAFESKFVESIIISSGVKTIDWFAFHGCTSLKSITVPSSVLSVEYGAFDYCPKDMVIKCSKGSYIEAYALSWGIAIITE